MFGIGLRQYEVWYFDHLLYIYWQKNIQIIFKLIQKHTNLMLPIISLSYY